MTCRPNDPEFESTVAALEWMHEFKPAMYTALSLVLRVQEERTELKLSEVAGLLLGAHLEADTRAALEDMFVSFRAAELTQAAQQ
ncbi:MAG: hypothetical protein ABI700_00760 [Chloroflexota bacterium]